MKQHFIEAVDNGNIIKVRIMLADELLLDPRGGSFDEMLEYAKGKLSNLFDENEEADYTVSPDRSTWDIELASTIKQDLVINFSVEKLELYKKVAKEIGKDKAKVLGEEKKQNHNRESAREQTINHRRDESRAQTIDHNREERREKRGDSSQTFTGGRASFGGSDNFAGGRVFSKPHNTQAPKCEKKKVPMKQAIGAATVLGGVVLSAVGGAEILCILGGAALAEGIVLLNEGKKKK